MDLINMLNIIFDAYSMLLSHFADARQNATVMGLSSIHAHKCYIKQWCFGSACIVDKDNAIYLFMVVNVTI